MSAPAKELAWRAPGRGADSVLLFRRGCLAATRRTPECAAAPGRQESGDPVVEEDVYSVAGLARPAVVVVDRWGIPHIRAEGFLDLFVAQGFNAARDRLWQMDLWRKRGLGLLAADLGPAYLRYDRAARLFLYRGDIDAEWATYGDDARAICEHFVAGVNAYVDYVSAADERLPPEFVRLGSRPGRWSADDIVRLRAHGVTRNAPSELARTLITARAGRNADLLRQDLTPPHDAFSEAPPLFDWLTADVLDNLTLATSPVTFERCESGAGGLSHGVSMLAEADLASQSQGSNNWSVSGARTATGRPILAGDPHRQPCMPALRYIVHLTSPEFDGIGAVEPHMPGITMGHNGVAGFGLTLFFGHDQEDLYVYDLHPDDPALYRYGEGWERMRTVIEPVDIRGEAAVDTHLAFTRHGPVIWSDAKACRAVAVRTALLEPGAAPYLHGLKAMRATSFDAFRNSLAGWSAPSVNQVYADVGGDIGWVVAGADPRRPNWDGLLPVPGDGGYEWDGFIDPATHPTALNPIQGFIATANEFNLPAAWLETYEATGWEWSNDARARRIKAVLGRQPAHSLEDSMALQSDVKSLPAEEICDLLRDLASDLGSAAAESARAVLLAWDHEVRAECSAAALYQVWVSEFLRPAVVAANVEDAVARRLIGSGSLAAIVERLKAERGDAAQRALLVRTLAEAWSWCERRFGASTADWSWGALHSARFDHPLGDPPQPAGPAWSLGPLPLGGDETTPLNARYAPGTFQIATYATFRMVLDVGDWDRSVCINAPGQSGHPNSPHYGDLAATWAAGGYVPMLYSKAAVDAAGLRTIRLEPAPAPTAV